jgi:hypothetical protein
MVWFGMNIFFLIYTLTLKTRRLQPLKSIFNTQLSQCSTPVPVPAVSVIWHYVCFYLHQVSSTIRGFLLYKCHVVHGARLGHYSDFEVIFNFFQCTNMLLFCLLRDLFSLVSCMYFHSLFAWSLFLCSVYPLTCFVFMCFSLSCFFMSLSLCAFYLSRLAKWRGFSISIKSCIYCCIYWPFPVASRARDYLHASCHNTHTNIWKISGSRGPGAPYQTDRHDSSLPGFNVKFYFKKGLFF